MKTIVSCLLSVSVAGICLAAEPYGLYSRDGKIAITETNGLWRVVNVGKSDWALAARGTTFDVKPGDVFRMSCAAGEIACNQVGVGMGVVFDLAASSVSGRAAYCSGVGEGSVTAEFLAPSIFGRKPAASAITTSSATAGSAKRVKLIF